MFHPCQGHGRSHTDSWAAHVRDLVLGFMGRRHQWFSRRGEGGAGEKRQEQQHSSIRALTISERMEVAKYPETIVGPFWGHSQLLQCSSRLKWKKKIIIKIIKCDKMQEGCRKPGTGGQRET